MSSIVAARTTSAFPLSVGTSLALESIFSGGGQSIDPDRQIPQPVNIRDYQEFWINLGTLFRNLYSSLPKSDIHNVGSGECADALLQEMEIIDSLVKEQSYSLTKTIYYICNYRSFDREYKHAHLRKYNTPRQLSYKGMHDDAIQTLIKQHPDAQNRIHILDMQLDPVDYPKGLILTHAPHDLLSVNKFKSLDLIESHTGLLRKRNTWHAKYYQGKDLSMLPFNKLLLQVMGDQEHFHPQNHKLRTAVVELAEKKHWTFATTLDKVRADLKEMKNQYAATLVEHLL